MALSAGKRVFRFDIWLDPAFDERLRRESGIELAVCPVSSGGEALAALARAHAYHCSAAKDELPRRWFVTDALLAKCPQLACVSSYGAGYDTIDVAACTRAGVAVLSQSGANADSVAEHTLGLVLALSRRMFEGDRRLRRERGFTREEVMGHDIRGRVLGLVGLGHCGTRVAKLARGFGMQVLAADPYLAREEIERRGATPVDFGDLLGRSDFVSLHCPRNKETAGMMGAPEFSRMKRGGFFITTSRGGIHDEAALDRALRSGHLAGAGLDVWEPEPPPLDHPLLRHDTVICTFHTAGVTHESRRSMAAMGAEQLVAFFRGERPPNLVNPEVWPACIGHNPALEASDGRT
jgi:D-3-phosphoglycerate dehydrogenase